MTPSPHDARDPPPIRRPLLACAALLAAGGVLAELGAALAPVAEGVVACGLAVAALALAAIRARPRVALALVVCAGAFVRARLALPAPPPADGVSSGAARVERVTASGDRDRVELDGLRAQLLVPPCSVAPGEAVTLLAHAAPAAWPRGPWPGPQESRGRARAPEELAPDELVRRRAAPATAANALARAVARGRERLLARSDALADPLARGFVRAFLFGDTRALPEGIGDLFLRTGTYHVLAISGMQVVLFAALFAVPLGALLERVLRALGFRSPRGEVLRLPAFALVVAAGGAGAPVVRSALCCALAPLARFARARRRLALGPNEIGVRERTPGPGLERTSDPLSLWSCALCIECLLDPLAPTALAVQLSYGATLGLIVGLRWMRARWPAENRPESSAELGLEPRWVELAVRRAGRAARLALCASAAAVLATLPFVWSRFGEWSPVGIVATPLLSLPMAAFLLAAWIWLCAPLVVPAEPLELCARAMTSILELCDRVAGSPVVLPPRPFLLLLGASAPLFVLWVLERRSRAPLTPRAPRAPRADGWLRAACAAWCALLVPWRAAPAECEVWAFDVGHGSALVVRTPDHGTWIYDAGSRDRPDVARQALAPALAVWEVGRLRVALSHSDRDHDAALDWLAQRFDVDLWAGALPESRAPPGLDHRTPRIDVASGELALTGAGTRLTLLRGLERDDNEGSRVLRVDAAGGSVLLCGDAEGEGLAALLERHGMDGPVEVLLLPHHGSDTELLAPLLERARPAEVWVSSPAAPAVGPELDRRGTRWRSTGTDGPLVWRAPRGTREPRTAAADDPRKVRFPARAAALGSAQGLAQLENTGAGESCEPCGDPSSPSGPGGVGCSLLGRRRREPESAPHAFREWG